MEKVYGVEVWNGTTAVYCSMFETLEKAIEYINWCKSNTKDGWYRYVSDPIEFRSEREFDIWQGETEGLY